MPVKATCGKNSPSCDRKKIVPIDMSEQSPARSQGQRQYSAKNLGAVAGGAYLAGKAVNSASRPGSRLRTLASHVASLGSSLASQHVVGMAMGKAMSIASKMAGHGYHFVKPAIMHPYVVPGAVAATVGYHAGRHGYRVYRDRRLKTKIMARSAYHKMVKGLTGHDIDDDGILRLDERAAGILPKMTSGKPSEFLKAYDSRFHVGSKFRTDAVTPVILHPRDLKRYFSGKIPDDRTTAILEHILVTLMVSPANKSNERLGKHGYPMDMYTAMLKGRPKLSTDAYDLIDSWFTHIVLRYAFALHHGLPDELAVSYAFRYSPRFISDVVVTSNRGVLRAEDIMKVTGNTSLKMVHPKLFETALKRLLDESAAHAIQGDIGLIGSEHVLRAMHDLNIETSEKVDNKDFQKVYRVSKSSGTLKFDGSKFSDGTVPHWYVKRGHGVEINGKKPTKRYYDAVFSTTRVQLKMKAGWISKAVALKGPVTFKSIVDAMKHFYFRRLKDSNGKSRFVDDLLGDNRFWDGIRGDGTVIFGS